MGCRATFWDTGLGYPLLWLCQGLSLHGLLLQPWAVTDHEHSCHSHRAAFFLSRGCKAPQQPWDPLVLLTSSFCCLTRVSAWVCVRAVLVCRYRRGGSRWDRGTFPPALLEGQDVGESIPRKHELQPKAVIQPPGLEKGSSGRMLMWSHFHDRGCFVSHLCWELGQDPSPLAGAFTYSNTHGQRNLSHKCQVGRRVARLGRTWSSNWVSTPLWFFSERLLCCGLAGALAPCEELLQLSTAANNRV